ncbi:MAG: ATP-binding cassette domain-containing protein, partial [Psychromonas sp.]
MITLQNLTKYYPSDLGPQYIFKNINFTIPDGHNIGILGSNGAGKSTLFRILAGSEYP